MFDKYSYKKKLVAMLVIFVLLLLVAHKRSFSLSFSSLDEINRLDQQLSSAANASYNINQLQLDINRLNGIIGKENFTSDFVQQNLLDEIADYSENSNIKLHGISETHSYSTKDFEIYSNEMVLEGDFVSLLKLINKIEKEVNYARIASGEFYTEKNYKSKKNQLYAKIYIQHFKKK